MSNLLRHLYERHTRRPLGSDALWLVELKSPREPIDWLLRTIPFSVPFERRAAIVQSLRNEDREAMAVRPQQ